MASYITGCMIPYMQQITQGFGHCSIVFLLEFSWPSITSFKQTVDDRKKTRSRFFSNANDGKLFNPRLPLKSTMVPLEN